MSSRLVFNKKDEFLLWVKTHCNSSQYEMFVTDYGEVVLAPSKSTRSLRYSVIDVYECWEDIDNALKEIKRHIPSVMVYRIKKFDWDSTKGVGVKQTV